MSNSRRWIGIVAVAMALVPASAPAANRKAPVDQLAREAQKIVLGTVIGKSSYWAGDSLIYTDITVAPEVLLKGADDGALVVRLPGGIVGDVEMTVSDSPEFADGESVLLFLNRNGGRYEVAGRDAGKFSARSASDAIETVLDTLERNTGRQLNGKRGEVDAYLHSMGSFRSKAGVDESNAAETLTCFNAPGKKWPNNQALYKIGTSIPATWAASINSAAQAWNQAGSQFSFVPDTSTVNELSFADLVAKYGTSYQSTYAVTTTWSMVSNNQITKSTIEVNTGFTWSPSGEAGKADVQGIMTHEFGHWLFLADLYQPAGCSEVTMWGYAALGETKKRSLEAADVQGVVSLYGSKTSSAVPSLVSPFNGAASVPVSTTLGWSAFSGAISYDVYFGTASSPAKVATVTRTLYAVSGLSNNVAYYWKIVANLSSGTAASATWAFTTVAAAPTSVTLLSPTNAATAIPATSTLSWTAFTGATSYDVYFGATSAPPKVGSTSGRNYGVTGLASGTRYYWRIVAISASGSVSSATWSFTTAPAAPVSVTLLAPANNATGVSITPTFTWTAITDATSYDVYMGTTSSPVLIGRVGSTTVQVRGFRNNTLYYWKIVARTGTGLINSPVWSFRTR